jgi:ATP-binding cassette subfamily B multidrug efflux pump
MREDGQRRKAYDSRLIRRLCCYLDPHRRTVAVASLLIVASSAFQIAPPYLIKIAIDDYIATGNVAGINAIGLLFLSVLLAAFAVDAAQTFTLQVMGQRVMNAIRLQIYQHLQRLDLQFYDRNPVGRLMTRVTSDVDVVNEMFTGGVVTVVADAVTLLSIMIVLLTLDWRLAVVMCCLVPLVVVTTEWFRRNVRDAYRSVRVHVASLNAFLQEHLTGMATVQLFNRQRQAFEQFDRINREHRDANTRSVLYYSLFYPLIEIIGALAVAVTLWHGGRWVVEGTLTLGTLVAFLQYTRRFFQPISEISEKLNLLQSAMASAEQIFDLLDQPAAEHDDRTSTGLKSEMGVGRLHTATESSAGLCGHEKGSLEPQLVFDHVWFAYHGEDYVLRDVSFMVAAGTRVGIVGVTGAGKSTVTNLLMRFYDVTRGRILVDGIDIRTIGRAELRSRFGLVLQDGQLFTGTIASNIRLGREDISDEMVRRAARAVNAERFIRQLPGGFDAPVAERGATLSVGQKQLLALARALAFDPPILLLDEATSSVDTETERHIQEPLHASMAGRTVIAIAHRLSTVQGMNTILVFHKGELREAGTHQDLLALRGIYYRLYKLQYMERQANRCA